MLGREEARAPEAVVERLVVRTTATKGSHHHVGGQVGIVRTETVAEPGPDAGTTGELVAGLAESDRGIVVDRFGVQRLHDRNVVDDAGNPVPAHHPFTMPHAEDVALLDTGNPRYLEFYKRQGYQEIGEVAVGPVREHVFFHANPQVLQTASA